MTRRPESGSPVPPSVSAILADGHLLVWDTRTTMVVELMGWRDELMVRELP